ncbi:unnamed protein product [Nyctereutes procyonoides]|uniref:(raccoon dog) hypothetical protein n=1 Tax=Nyctereutes procyonoides TaxID=34880 RepID=A0A811YKP2_NYCPR|nr:unnamed protein product [Nyctereutes procyonoides]
MRTSSFSLPQAGAYDFPFCSSKFEPVCWVILKLYLLREHSEVVLDEP